MNNALPAYRKLLARARKIALLDSAAACSPGTEETYMPARALDHRAGQLAYLSGEAHRLFTARKVGEWISECEQHGFAPGSDEAANVREWRRSYDRKTKIPARLVEKFQRLRAHAREAWGEAAQGIKIQTLPPASPEADGFAPAIFRLVGLHRFALQRASRRIRARREGRGFARTVRPKLRPEIVAILGPAMERSAATPRSILHGHYPVAAQQAFNREVAQAMGFDFAAGGLTPRRIRFAAGWARTTAGSPRATTSRFHAVALRRHARGRPRALRSGSAARNITARRWARRCRSASMNRSRVSGKITSAAARLLATLASRRVQTFPGTEPPHAGTNHRRR